MDRPRRSHRPRSRLEQPKRRTDKTPRRSLDRGVFALQVDRVPTSPEGTPPMNRYIPLPPPTPREADELAVAGRYLSRAASAAGTRRLDPWLPPGEAALLDVQCDQAAAAAA